MFYQYSRIYYRNLVTGNPFGPNMFEYCSSIPLRFFTSEKLVNNSDYSYIALNLYYNFARTTI